MTVPCMKGVKQNKKYYSHHRHICGSHTVLMYPSRSAGGQKDGGTEVERGMGCRQKAQIWRGITETMQRTSPKNAGIVISGKGSGKTVAKRNVITFSQKKSQHQ